jgi:hypothetical protein
MLPNQSPKPRPKLLSHNTNSPLEPASPGSASPAAPVTPRALGPIPTMGGLVGPQALNGTATVPFNFNINSQATADAIIKQGFLTKQGGARGGLKNWKRRWVVLKQDCLYYYKTKPPESSGMGSSESGKNSLSSTAGPNRLSLPALAPANTNVSAGDASPSPPLIDDPAHTALSSQDILSGSEDDTNITVGNTPLLLGVTLLRGAKVIDLTETPNPMTASFLRAPELDQVSQVCSECKRYFGMILRRQNCRNCGKAFCKQHLPIQIEIPKYGYLKPVPVCMTCALSLKEKMDDDNNSPVNGTQPLGQAIDDRDSFSDDDEPVVERLSRTASIVGRKSLFGTRKNMFAIKSPERELWLSADDEQEKMDWINAIKREIANTRRNIKIRNMLNQHEEWELDFSYIKMIKKLGQGAFGEVFLGRLWGTDVAVKMFKPEQITEDTIGVLKKEIAILSRLRHPNVVLYMGACTRPPNVCIVTESCEQGSLYEVLHDYSIHIDAQRVIDIAVGIAQGMNYLHSLDKRIIHRDLKVRELFVFHSH